MSKYQVEVVETLSRVVEVEAEDYDEAENEVTKMYDNEEIVLDWQDLESTEYKQYPSPKMKDNFVINIDYIKENNSLTIKNCSGKGEIATDCKDINELLFLIRDFIENHIEVEEEKNIQEMER